MTFGQEDYFIIKVIKEVPPIVSDTFENWLKEIHNKYMTNVRLEPILSQRLLWIWLARNGMVIPNIEKEIMR